MKTAVLAIAALFSTTLFGQEQPPLSLWYDAPAAHFEQSLPIGNGRLGAVVYGGTARDTVFLNDITLWTGTPVDPEMGKGAAKWVPAIRQTLFSEDYRRADSLQLHVQGSNSQYYRPLATMVITDHNTTPATAYRRRLDLDSALVQDSYRRGLTTYRREYLASSPDQVVAIDMRADGPDKLHCTVALASQVAHSVRATAQGQLTMTGRAADDALNSVHFCAILQVDAHGGSVSASGDSAITIANTSRATIYFVNRTSFNGPRRHPVTQASPYIEAAADDAWHLVNLTYEDIRERHIDDYAALFGRFRLAIGHAQPDTLRPTDRQLLDYTDHGEPNHYLETLYAQYGRYLLISSSRTPGVPANLQGLWAIRPKQPWRGNYTININLEENYWPAEIAALPEMFEPLDSFVRALAVNGANVAKQFYGIGRGWCAGHNSDLWAMANPVGERRESPKWSNWNMGGAWLTMLLWEHFQYSRDTLYLRSAYSVIKGAAQFCLDWLVENPHRPGELLTAPSTSPENMYQTPQGYRGATLYGATADMAIIRELFINVTAAADVLGVDRAFADSCRSALDRLTPYKIGRKGNLQEWYHDWDDPEPGHRHQSHLIGLYPGNHLTADSLLAACARTLELRGDKTTGWSTGWRINLWARLLDGERAYATLRHLLTYVSPDGYRGADRRRSGGTYPNLFDAHPPFQIDGNFGGTAGLCEMLLQSHRGRIELLPAIPSAWSEGRVSGIRARGGFSLDFAWSQGRVVEAVISSPRGGTTDVVVNGKTLSVDLAPGETRRIEL